MKSKMITALIAIILMNNLIIYHIPKDLQKSYSVSLQTGEELQRIEVKVALQVSRRLLSENKVNGSVTIQGHAYQVHNEAGNFLDVGKIIQKLKGRPYHLHDMSYDKESNRVLRTVSIDISRDLTTMSGTVTGQDQADPTYFTSTE